MDRMYYRVHNMIQPRPEHVDREWIRSKINGHAAAWFCTGTTGLARISFIFGTSKVQIAKYNGYLYGRYFLRKLKGEA